MGSVEVIAMQPARQQGQAFLVGVIGLDVGPLLEQGAVESLHLAVHLWCVEGNEDVLGAELTDGSSEILGAPIAEVVIGHHPLDPNPMRGQEAGGSAQECST